MALDGSALVAESKPYSRLTAGPSTSSDRDALGMTRSGQSAKLGDVVRTGPLHADARSQEETLQGHQVECRNHVRGSEDRSDRSYLAGRQLGVEFPNRHQKRFFDGPSLVISCRLDRPG